MTTIDKDKNKIKQKFQVLEGLFNFAYTTKYFQLKKKHKDWSREEIHKKTMELIEKGCA